MNDLEMYREQLALCDDKIIDALVERNAIIEKIMAYKETYGMPILQPAQEAKQERRLNEKLKDNKYQDEIHDVFKRILRNSKNHTYGKELENGREYFSDWIYGSRKIHDFRLLKHHVRHETGGDGSGDRRT